MAHLYTYIRASLALVGVALGLIVTAGAASAADAGDLTVSEFGRGCADVVVPEEYPGMRITVSVSCAASVGATTEAVVELSQQVDDPTIGDAITVVRPVPGRDPALELGAVTPTPAAAPASEAVEPAPAAVIDSGALVVTRPQAVVAAAPVARPSRPTQVLGAQFVRTDSGGVLARTGVGSFDLALVAIGLVALGTAMIRFSAPRRTR